jgi:hypothetical protein
MALPVSQTQPAILMAAFGTSVVIASSVLLHLQEQHTAREGKKEERERRTTRAEDKREGEAYLDVAFGARLAVGLHPQHVVRLSCSEGDLAQSITVSQSQTRDDRSTSTTPHHTTPHHTTPHHTTQEYLRLELVHPRIDVLARSGCMIATICVLTLLLQQRMSAPPSTITLYPHRQ